MRIFLTLYKMKRMSFLNNKQKESYNRCNSLFVVVPPGIEPGTQGFSVLCSTN